MHQRKGDVAAVKRNEKSIALLMAKMLCEHKELKHRAFRRGADRMLSSTCTACKAYVSTLQ